MEEQNNKQIKTKMDFDGADKDLKEVKEVYDKHGVKFWLFAGTLLGAIRNKDYIPYDHDMDCGMYFEDNDKIPEIFKELRERGFKCMTGPSIETKNKVRKYFAFKIYRNELIDMLCFVKLKDKRVYVHGGLGDNKMSTWWNDSKFFDELNMINFRGTEYYIPSHVEEGLDLWYGNWKKPGGGAFWSYGIKMSVMDKDELFPLIS